MHSIHNSFNVVALTVKTTMRFSAVTVHFYTCVWGNFIWLPIFTTKLRAFNLMVPKDTLVYLRFFFLKKKMRITSGVIVMMRGGVTLKPNFLYKKRNIVIYLRKRNALKYFDDISFTKNSFYFYKNTLTNVQPRNYKLEYFAWAYNRLLTFCVPSVSDFWQRADK